MEPVVGADAVNILCGTTILTSEHITEEAIVPRSWRERLLSLPWRPLKKTKRICRPGGQIYVGVIGGRRTVLCHPIMFDRLKKEASHGLG